MTWVELTYSFGVALGVGLLVGFEREQSQSDREREDRRFGGSRTFPLLSLLGAVAGALQPSLGWGIPAVITGVLGLVFVALVVLDVLDEERGRGITTEVAGLLVYLLGLLAAMPIEGLEHSQRWVLCAALATVLLGLLALRPALHSAARGATRRQLQRVFQIGVVVLVVVPLLYSMLADVLGDLIP